MNLVVIDLTAGTAFAFRDRERVAGGAIPGWTGRDVQFERGKLELFRQVPTTYRFQPQANAHEEGRAAFRLGSLRTGNPFPPSCGPDYERWDRGWQMESNIQIRRTTQ